MSTDAPTLAFYAAHAEAYAAAEPRPADAARLDAFAARLAPGARVLDLGSGGGWALAALRARGLRADGIEPVRALAEAGAAAHGAEARPGHFLTLSARQRYDGLWSNFALHHAPRESRGAIFERIHTALRPGGLLHVAVPKGPADWRDSGGRLFAPFTQGELEALLAGFADPEWERDAGETWDGTRVLQIFVTARRS